VKKKPKLSEQQKKQIVPENQYLCQMSRKILRAKKTTLGTTRALHNSSHNSPDNSPATTLGATTADLIGLLTE
jgi:hypothetical protein